MPDEDEQMNIMEYFKKLQSTLSALAENGHFSYASEIAGGNNCLGHGQISYGDVQLL